MSDHCCTLSRNYIEWRDHSMTSHTRVTTPEGVEWESDTCSWCGWNETAIPYDNDPAWLWAKATYADGDHHRCPVCKETPRDKGKRALAIAEGVTA